MLAQTIAGWKEGIYNHSLDAEGKRSFGVFLPQAYEPRYPYPLLVMLHGQGETERQWLEAAPLISRRNYVCLSLRGPIGTENVATGRMGYRWTADGGGSLDDADLETYVLDSIRETMRASHVHSERIFLAGIGEGAMVAYQMALAYPKKFAGAVALNGWLPRAVPPLGRVRDFRRLGFFIGHGAQNKITALEDARKSHALFHAAGISSTMCRYPTNDRISAAMLRDVDRWIIHRCQRADRRLTN